MKDSIKISEVTKDQSNRILKETEGHFLDLKAIEIAPAKLTKTVSAFANASGGELYIGIDEHEVDGIKSRSWRGFNDPEAANGHIQIFEALFPLGQYYTYTFLQCLDLPGLVLQVEVRKTRDVTPASDGVAYLRRGAQSLPQTTEDQIKRLKLDKGVASFEKETVDVPVELISNSIPVLEFLTNVIPTAEPESWLVKQVLVSGGKPTVAGILLFAEEPQAILPKRCGVKIYRYKSTEAAGTRETLAFDPITIEGHIYAQIRDSINKTVQLIEDIQIRGARGLETIQYPRETLHEILTNAVLHRDYSIATDIQVRIFDNRIEIESPGRLPGHVTVDNILTEQLARNGGIVRMINKFPDAPNKDVGEGLNTAFNAMRTLRLKEPVIEERESSVVIHIKHEPLASPDQTIMEYLETHTDIVNRVARQITGIGSENSMKRVFYRLRDAGEIEQVPGASGFASAWRKKTGNPTPPAAPPPSN